MKLLSIIFLILSTFNLFGQVEEIQNIQTCASSFLDEWNTAVDDQYGLNVIDPENDHIGFKPVKKGGHILDEGAAIWKFGLLDSDDNWIPVTGQKGVSCGLFYKLYYYDSHFGPLNYDNKEQDYGLYIVPDSKHQWLLDSAKSIFGRAYPNTLSVESFLKNKSEWHKTKGNKFLIEAEIDPHKQFRSYSGFNISNNTSFLIDENVCAYGPVIVERIHDYRPEIHPAEAFWSKLENGKSAHVFLWHDASNRFNDSLLKPIMKSNGELDSLCYCPTDINWANGPKKNTIQIPFKYENGYIDQYHIKLGTAYSKDVHLQRSAPFGREWNHYELKYNNEKLVELEEKFPQLYKINSEVCMDGNIVKGFVNLEVEMGYNNINKQGYIHLELMKNEKYIGKNSWKMANGIESSPFLDSYNSMKYEEGNFNDFKYLDINGDGKTDILEIRSDSKWYVSYSAERPWELFHEEPNSYSGKDDYYFFGNFTNDRRGDEIIRLKNNKIEMLGAPEPIMSREGLLENKRRFKSYSHSSINIPPFLKIAVADVDGNGTLDIISTYQGRLHASFNGGKTRWDRIAQHNPVAGSGNVKIDQVLFVTTEKPIQKYELKKASTTTGTRPSKGGIRNPRFEVESHAVNNPVGLATEGTNNSNKNRAINHIIYKVGNKLFATNWYLKKWIELDVKLNPSINFFRLDEDFNSERFLQGDFNGDMNTDFIFYDADKNRISFQSFGKNTQPISLLQKANSYKKGMAAVGVGDFNGDGRSDLLENGGPLQNTSRKTPTPSDLYTQEINPSAIKYANGNLQVGYTTYKQAPPKLFGQLERAVVSRQNIAFSQPNNTTKYSLKIGENDIDYQLTIVENVAEESIKRFGKAIKTSLQKEEKQVINGRGSVDIELLPMYGVIKNTKIEVLEDNYFTSHMNFALANQVDTLITKFFGSIDHFVVSKKISVAVVRNGKPTTLKPEQYDAFGIEIKHRDGILKNGITSFSKKTLGGKLLVRARFMLKDPFNNTKFIEKKIVLE